MPICERCKKTTNIITTSYLNTQELCPECKEEEKKHPLYPFAKEIERQEILKGNYNYEGLLTKSNEEIQMLMEEYQKKNAEA
jgi:recombinational DNA repair protein (RecF pathway)